MHDTTADLFLSMSITFAIFGICYYYLTTRYKERISLLEKGLPKDYFKDTSNHRPFILLLGIVSIGIATGIILGAFLEAQEIRGYEDFFLPFALFLCLGVSLVISYFVLKAMGRNNTP